MNDRVGKRLNKYGVWENVALTEKEWSNRWQNQQIAFHQPNVAPSLIKYEEMTLKPNSRVFLPLCGKSVDLVYLADKGHDVHGCEFVEQAVQEFFNEQSIQFEVFPDKSGKMNIYKGINKKVTLYRGDFFHLSSQTVGKFDAIWDRASIVAINTDQRAAYAAMMIEMMSPQCKYLLNTFDFEGDDYYGPPHSVSNQEVQKLFGDACKISMLDSERLPSPFPRSTFITITNALLTLKSAQT